jgi:hypothetical protein
VDAHQHDRMFEKMRGAPGVHRSAAPLAAQQGEELTALAERCGVTLEMARYRSSTTGNARQAARRYP